MASASAGRDWPSFADDDHVGAVISELAAQLGLHVDVKVHHRGGDGGGNDHREQRGGGASATKDSGAEKHARKHGSMRRPSAAIGDLLRSEERSAPLIVIVWSSFTSQGEDGIELYGAANGGGASGKGHKNGDGQDDREEHGLDGNLRVENRPADLARQQRSRGKSGNAADQREQQRLRKKDRRDREIARAESFHQTDFYAALIDGRGHGSGNGKRGRETARRA